MLIWLYLVWAAVIFGAVVTAAISEFKELPKDRTKELKVFEYRKTNTYRKNKHYVKKFLPKEQT